MPLRMAFTIGCLLVSVAIAQTKDELRSKIATVHYPPLAEAARIQGDVHLEVNSGVVKLLSGHPLLAPPAIESAKSFGSIQGQTTFDVTYHFVFVDTATSVPTSKTVKRGNALERVLLRMFGLKTEKVVQYYQCQTGLAPASDVKTDGAIVKVWIYGRTFCLQPNTALVARR